MSIEEIRQKVFAHPEVTREEALAHGMMICARAEAGDEAAFLCMAEIVGNAATIGETEMLRRFIALEAEEGPLSR